MEILANVGLYHYLIVALIVFCIGLVGVVVSDNIIKTVLCFFLIFNSIGINFIAFSINVDSNNLSGFVVQLFIIAFSVVQIILLIYMLIKINKKEKSLNLNQIDSKVE